MNIVLENQNNFSFFNQNKILVPMSNPKTQEALLMLSNTLLANKGGEIIVLAVKDVPSDAGFYEALQESEETLNVIKRSVKMAEGLNIKIKPIIRASRKISRGIVNVAEEENSQLIVMGFPAQLSEQPSFLSQVIASTYTDMLILNLKTKIELFSPKTIGIYINNAGQLDLMLMCAKAMAEKYRARIVLVSFLPEDYHKKQKSKADKMLAESLQNLNTTALYDLSLSTTNDPQAELISRSAQFDLLILGMPHGLKGKAIDESSAFQIAQKAQCSVIVTNNVSQIRKLVKRL